VSAQQAAPGDHVERFFAAASTVWCVPRGEVGPGLEPVGPLMRASALNDLAFRAGSGHSEVLGIEHPFWHVHLLVR